MAIPTHLQLLMSDVKHWDHADRALYLSVIGEAAESLPPEDAVDVAQFMINQLSSPEDGGKIVVVTTLRDLVKRFGGHPSFAPFLENYENELALCLLGTHDPRVMRYTKQALDAAPIAPRQLGTQLRSFDEACVFA